MKGRDPFVSITPLPGASAATIIWSWKGATFVTAVVKATFSLVADGPMKPAAPEPIFHRERSVESGVGLRSAGDLAPYLPQTDVCLVGHTVVPERATRVTAELGIRRDGTPLLDSRIELTGLPGARVRVGGMGPISKDWPLRRRLLGACDPKRLEGPILDIPESFDWSYFQAAPAHQRIPHLGGLEWITLGGVFADRPRLSSRLPGARAEVRLGGQVSEIGGRRSMQMVLDSLLVDADRGSCTLVWRGNVPVPSVSSLSSLHLVAGVELPDRAPVFSDGPATAEATARSAEDEASTSTVLLGGPAALKAAMAPATPFTPPREDASAVEGETIAPVLRRAASTLPFRSGPPASTGSAPAVTPEPATPRGRSPEEVSETSTVFLGGGAAREAARAPATPFAPRAEDAVSPDGETIAPALHRAASTLPFRAGPPASGASAPAEEPEPATPRRRSTEEVSESSTVFLGGLAAVQAAMAPATPFARPGAPSPAEAAPSVLPRVATYEVVKDDAGAQEPVTPRAQKPAGEPLLPLETYAAIKAARWAAPASSMAGIVEARGMTEVEWLVHEERYAEAITEEAKQGRSELMRSVRAAITAAEAQRADGADELSIDEFVALRVACETAADPAEPLAARGLSSAAYRRLRSRWQDRARADPVVGADLQARLAAARLALAS